MLFRTAVLAALLSTLPNAILAQAPSQGAGLPAQKLGPEDLISVQVYNFPELSRTVRVAADGSIQLPLLKTAIPVAGKFPYELEPLVADVLRNNDLVVNPTITITVVEYAGRPISVVGAVRTP